MAPATDLLTRDDAVLVVVDVQERINSVMVDQAHLPRIAVLVQACAALGVPVGGSLSRCVNEEKAA